MHSTRGAPTETAAGIVPFLPDMSLLMSSAMKISTITALGNRRPITDPSGIRRALSPAGLRTGWAIGTISRRGATPGLMIARGVSLHFITADGSGPAVPGDGRPH